MVQVSGIDLGKEKPMTDYIEKSLEGDYKDFIKSLMKIVGNEIDKKRFR